MPAGLASYLRAIPATKSEKIGARGTVVVLRECQSDLEVKLHQNKVGRRDGTVATLILRRGEKWFSPEEFDEVEVRNTSDTVDQVVELLIGGGDFVPPPPNVVVSDTIFGGAVVGPVHDDILVAAANPSRKRIIIKASIDNTVDMWIHEGGEALLKGIPLSAGESITLETKGRVGAQSDDNLVDNQYLYYLEELYDV